MSTPVKSLLQSRLLLSPRLISPVRNFPVINLQVPSGTNESDKSFLINTPNKIKLTKHGVDSSESVLDFLGYGRFGAVFKGKYRGSRYKLKSLQLIIKFPDKTVAVKVVNLGIIPEIREENALSFRHKNIIHIIEVIKHPQERFGVILMDYYMNSESLQALLNGDFPLNKSKIVYFCKDIVEGLIYCHENKIFHLDIKPKNILLCGKTCKICDFGNSYRLGDENYIFNGTAIYASPEMLSGKAPTSKCDIYSFGITLWQMLSKKLPYESMNIEVVIYKVVKFSFRPDLNEVLLENVEDLLNLCCSCWRDNAKDRPELKEICNVLENVEIK